MITKDNGEIVTQAYLRARVVAYLSGYRAIYPLDRRHAAIKRTVDNADWMRGKSGQTVGSICRAVSFEV
jgi:hypothetical protein